MSAKKTPTPQAIARHEKSRQDDTARGVVNLAHVRELNLGERKRPSKLVRQAKRAQARHEDALRLAAAARRAPEGGDAA